MEIITLEKKDALTVFTSTNGTDYFIRQIEEEVNTFIPNLKTAKSRSEIASMAAKVAKSKTYLDSKGKELVDELKRQPKLVDAERKRMRDALDALRDKVRKPLTDWENAEKERVHLIVQKLDRLSSLPEIDVVSDILKKHLKDLEETAIDDSFGEFANEAATLKDAAINSTRIRLNETLKREKESEELEILRRESAEQEQKEREERIAKEAEDRAKKQAEESAQKAIDEANAAAEKSRLAALEAEKRERESKEAEERRAAQIEEDKKQAELLAEKRIADAKREESERIAKEAEDEEAERKRRSNLKKHRDSVIAETIHDLKGIATFDGISDEAIKHLLREVYSGNVRHLTINF